MKKSLTILFVSVLILSVIPFILAAENNSCSDVEIPSSVLDFLNEIPTLNTELQKCPVEIPSSVDFLVGDGNVLAEIILDSGEIANFYVSFSDNNLTAIMNGEIGDYEYKITTNETTIGKVLGAEDIQGEILNSYNNEEIRIKPKGLINKVKWFIGKIFIPK